MSHPRLRSVFPAMLAATVLAACSSTSSTVHSGAAEVATVPDRFVLGDADTQWLLEFGPVVGGVDAEFGVLADSAVRHTVLIGSGTLRSAESWGPRLPVEFGAVEFGAVASVVRVGESPDCAQKTVVAGVVGSAAQTAAPSLAWRGPLVASMVGVPMTWSGSELPAGGTTGGSAALAAPSR